MELLKIWNANNISTREYYIESLEELKDLPEDVPVASIVLILTENGLVIKMKNSQGAWVDIWDKKMSIDIVTLAMANSYTRNKIEEASSGRGI